MTPSLGIEPGSLWWEASDLTSAPTKIPAQVLNLDYLDRGDMNLKIARSEKTIVKIRLLVYRNRTYDLSIASSEV